MLPLCHAIKLLCCKLRPGVNPIKQILASITSKMAELKKNRKIKTINMTYINFSVITVQYLDSDSDFIGLTPGQGFYLSTSNYYLNIRLIYFYPFIQFIYAFWI